MPSLAVVVDTPAYSALGGTLSYACEGDIPAGTLVRVPLGRRVVPGIAWGAVAESGVADAALRPVEEQLAAVSPMEPAWRALVSFAAAYYQRSLGEIALQALPPELRKLSAVQLQRRVKRVITAAPAPEAGAGPVPPPLTGSQEAALRSIAASLDAGTRSEIPTGAASAASATFLLYGATGSGKTEVYLRAVASALMGAPQAQVLVLVPEINLTPQLEAQFAARFPGERIVAMHSAMTPAQRLRSWLAAHEGIARIVLGTRMAIFASLPALRLIIVDEEHDPSYKQYEGARWSARDLAVWRGWHEHVPVVLGSATPSLESWQHAHDGRYTLLEMPDRIGGGTLPRVRLLDMRQVPKGQVLAPALVRAMEERLARGEQSLVLLNRRGYAPVLHCPSCGWQSECPHCSAFRVFHRVDRTLRCHHCGFTEPVPRACPQCGEPDLQAVGRGTERLEEQLAALLHHPDGAPARIVRIDADSTRLAGSLVRQLAEVHEGEVDVLVGTQMIAKGHDFRRITLVAAVNADSALFSSDFRASERLFSLLMQAAGRAGRDAALAGASELWVQTYQPEHPLFQALKSYDFPAFASETLAERRLAGLPPFAYLALIRSDARTQQAAQDYLRLVHDSGQQLLASMGAEAAVTLYPPVPMALQRVADVERAQMLVESGSRQALQRFLAAWQPALHAARSQTKGVIRWAVDVDPQAI